MKINLEIAKSFKKHFYFLIPNFFCILLFVDLEVLSKLLNLKKLNVSNTIIEIIENLFVVNL